MPRELLTIGQCATLGLPAGVTAPKVAMCISGLRT